MTSIARLTVSVAGARDVCAMACAATDLPSEDSDDGLAPQQAREEAHRRFLAALQTHVNQHAEHLIATYNGW